MRLGLIGALGMLAACSCSDSPPPDTGPLTPSVDHDGDGLSKDDGDCDDANIMVYPGAPEVPWDGLDQDCDGADVEGDPLDSAPFLAETTGFDAFGRDVALGDFDGDGSVDLVVSAGGMPVGYTEVDGAVLLFDDPLATDSAQATTVLDLVWPDRLVPVGDLDGDGATDLLVQDGSALVYGSGLGAVLLEGPDLWGRGCGADLTGNGLPDVVMVGYVGATGFAHAFDGGLRGEVAPADAFATVAGEVVDCRDLDGDGVADLVTGSGGDRIAVHHGPLSGTPPEDGSWVGQVEDSVGFAIQIVTDIDGDGLDDALATSLFAEDRASVVHLLSGPATGTNHAMTDATAQFVGDPSMHFLGWSLADAGDLDGDGYGDPVLASTGWNHVPSVVLQFHGPVSGTVTADQSSRVWVGERRDYAGQGIAFGDIDGNGTTDMILGAPGPGRVYRILDL